MRFLGCVSVGQRRQRLIDDAEKLDEVLLVGLDIEDPGCVLAPCHRFVQLPERADLVGRLVILGHFGEHDLRSVVQCHCFRRTGVVLNGNVFEERDKAHVG